MIDLLFWMLLALFAIDASMDLLDRVLRRYERRAAEDARRRVLREVRRHD